MELVYRVIKLQFSDEGEYTHPIATVRVAPAGAPLMSAAFIDMQIKPILDAAGAAPPLQAAADAALAAAHALLNAGAVDRHLALLLAAEDLQRQQDDAAFQLTLRQPDE